MPRMLPKPRLMLIRHAELSSAPVQEIVDEGQSASGDRLIVSIQDQDRLIRAPIGILTQHRLAVAADRHHHSIGYPIDMPANPYTRVYSPVPFTDPVFTLVRQATDDRL